MAPDWYAVTNDLALFLGETMVTRSLNLSWQFFTASKKDIPYPKTAISGFSGAPKPEFEIDPVKGVTPDSTTVRHTRLLVAVLTSATGTDRILPRYDIASGAKFGLRRPDQRALDVMRSGQAGRV